MTTTPKEVEESGKVFSKEEVIKILKEITSEVREIILVFDNCSYADEPKERVEDLEFGLHARITMLRKSL